MEEKTLELLQDRSPAYESKHGAPYYWTVNAWLRQRGFEASSAQVIDTMDLPNPLRQQAKQAEQIIWV